MRLGLAPSGVVGKRAWERDNISNRLILAIVAVVLVVAGGVALAQTGGPYNLGWHTFDGGGGTASGGPYTLSGTAGQADAGAVMSSGSYTLSGGFWGGAASQSTTYLPLVRRNSAGGYVPCPDGPHF